MHTNLHDDPYQISITNDLLRYRALMDVLKRLEARKAKLSKQMSKLESPTLEDLVPPESMSLSQERFVARLLYGLLLLMSFTVVVLLDTPFARGQLSQYNYVWGTFITSIALYFATISVDPGVLSPKNECSSRSDEHNHTTSRDHPSTSSSASFTPSTALPPIAPTKKPLCFAWFAHSDCLTRVPPSNFYLPGITSYDSFSTTSSSAHKHDDCCDPSPITALTVSIPQISNPEEQSLLAATAGCSTPPLTYKTCKPLQHAPVAVPAPTAMQMDAQEPPMPRLGEALLQLCPSLPQSLLAPMEHRIRRLHTPCHSSSSQTVPPSATTPAPPPSPVNTSESPLDPPAMQATSFSPVLSTSLTWSDVSTTELLELPPLHTLASLSPLAPAILHPRFCLYCLIPRPELAKHCHQCQVCVARHDHHCPFIGGCVGARNHLLFTLFLVFSIVSLITAMILNYHALPSLPCPHKYKFPFITISIPSFLEASQCPPSAAAFTSQFTDDAALYLTESAVLSPQTMWVLHFFFQILFGIVAAFVLPLTVTHIAMLFADYTTPQFLKAIKNDGNISSDSDIERNQEYNLQLSVNIPVVNGLMGHNSSYSGASDVELNISSFTASAPTRRQFTDGRIEVPEDVSEGNLSVEVTTQMPLLRNNLSSRGTGGLFSHIDADEDFEDKFAEKTTFSLFCCWSTGISLPKPRIWRVLMREFHRYSSFAVAWILQGFRNIRDAATCYKRRDELWLSTRPAKSLFSRAGQISDRDASFVDVASELTRLQTWIHENKLEMRC